MNFLALLTSWIIATTSTIIIQHLFRALSSKYCCTWAMLEFIWLIRIRVWLWNVSKTGFQCCIAVGCTASVLGTCSTTQSKMTQTLNLLIWCMDKIRYLKGESVHLRQPSYWSFNINMSRPDCSTWADILSERYELSTMMIPQDAIFSC